MNPNFGKWKFYIIIYMFKKQSSQELSQISSKNAAINKSMKNVQINFSILVFNALRRFCSIFWQHFGVKLCHADLARFLATIWHKHYVSSSTRFLPTICRQIMSTDCIGKIRGRSRLQTAVMFYLNLLTVY